METRKIKQNYCVKVDGFERCTAFEDLFQVFERVLIFLEFLQNNVDLDNQWVVK